MKGKRRYGLDGMVAASATAIAQDLGVSLGEIRAAEVAAMKHLRMAFGVPASAPTSVAERASAA